MTKYFNFLFLAFGFVFFTACVDNVIDEPPIKDFLELETNATIQDILDIWKVGQILPIEEDLVFDAIVVGDDQSGNFYKSIVLQDETGGITVRIEANNIYSVLPQGRKVFVRAQGMYVGDFAGLPQIGFEIEIEDGEESLATIPYTLIGDADESLLVPSLRDQDLEPNVVTINELNSSLLNTLIKLEDVQFNISELGLTFANADDPTNGVNRELEDCDGNNIVVRTSDFCDFAGLTLPEGNGDLVGIYTIFGPTQQFTIRSLDDISLDGVRCGEVVVDVPEANATIGDILALYSEGSVTSITDDLVVDGIVTANDISGNFYKQIVIEDENDAINIQIDDFDLYEKFYLGRRVVVDVKNLVVGDFAGLPQIGILDADGDVGRISSSQYPTKVFAAENEGELTPTTVSISELQNATFFNKLIKLVDVEFNSSALGNTYADEVNELSLEHNISNCDEELIILRSSGYSDFASNQLPEGNGSITAIYSVFNGKRQLVIRKVQDVSFNGERCDGSSTGDVPVPNATIADIMALYSEGNVNSITEDLIIDGIVTANDISGNFFKQITIEDENDAINIQIDDFDLFETYELGRKVVVKTKGLAIGDFNGLPQIGADNGNSVGRISAGAYPTIVYPSDFEGQITPTDVTLTELETATYYNKLIRLQDVEFADAVLGNTFADADNSESYNHDLEDCNGGVVIFRSSGYADFASTKVPEGNGTIVAIFSVYQGTRQLLVRQVSDVDLEGVRCE